MTQAQLLMGIQATLGNIRNAMSDAAKLYAWSSGVAQADLEGLGFSAADATAVLTACNDANALAQYYFTGAPPAGYPQPASEYRYGASQVAVIGPQ